MKSLGISLEDSELKELRILAVGDRRSISWLLRAAVKEYLKTRKDDVHRYSVKQAMEQLAEQSERQRAQEKEDRMVQEVMRMAEAAGMNSDPESVKAAIAASIKTLTAKLAEGLSADSSESAEQKKAVTEAKASEVPKSKAQVIQHNREQLLAEAEARFEKKQAEKLKTKSK